IRSYRSIPMRHRQPRQESNRRFEIVEPFIHGGAPPDALSFCLSMIFLKTAFRCSGSCYGNRMQFDSLDDIRAFCRDLPGGDQRAAENAALRQQVLTKPPGSLGLLEELAIWLARW